MKTYTIQELNRYHYTYPLDNLVCHITSFEQWKYLKKICPNITSYNKEKSFYLCSSEGSSDCPYYTTIEFNQLPLLYTHLEIY